MKEKFIFQSNLKIEPRKIKKGRSWRFIGIIFIKSLILLWNLEHYVEFFLILKRAVDLWTGKGQFHIFTVAHRLVLEHSQSMKAVVNAVELD